jgi:hypothetical protein
MHPIDTATRDGMFPRGKNGLVAALENVSRAEHPKSGAMGKRHRAGAE